MSPRKRYCKSCRTPIDDNPPEDPRCEPCTRKLEDWLEDSSPNHYYKPRFDGAYFDDEG